MTDVNGMTTETTVSCVILLAKTSHKQLPPLETQSLLVLSCLRHIVPLSASATYRMSKKMNAWEDLLFLNPTSASGDDGALSLKCGAIFSQYQYVWSGSFVKGDERREGSFHNPTLPTSTLFTSPDASNVDGAMGNCIPAQTFRNEWIYLFS